MSVDYKHINPKKDVALPKGKRSKLALQLMSLGLTQRDFALTHGFPPATVSAALCGKRDGKKSKLIRQLVSALLEARRRTEIECVDVACLNSTPKKEKIQ